MNLDYGPAWTDIVQAVASIVSALASVALLAVAFLFREEVRAARRRPLLYLSFEQSSADTVPFGNPHASYWVRFRVGNERGRDTALRVQLLLLGVHQIIDGTEHQLDAPSRPFRTSDVPETRIDISSYTERRFDIAYLKVPDPETVRAQSVELEFTGVNLALNPRSSAGRDVFGVGAYRLLMVLTADNADASYWTVDITLKKSPEYGDDLTSLLIVSRPMPLGNRPAM